MTLLDEDQRIRLTAYHADGTEWIEQLPDLVDQYTHRWTLRLGPTFRPGGDASWTARVTRADGTPALLKIAFPDPAEGDAMALLRLLDGTGAVRLLEHDPDDHAALLELCDPGTYAASLPLATADDAIAAVLPPLWALSSSQLPQLPHLSDIAMQRAHMLRERGEQLEDQLLQEGADLYSSLAASSDAQCVLHGDANQRNVLQSQRGWLAIDPRPMVGDPSYELAMWVTTRLDEVDAPVERVTALAKRLDLPEDRALAWVAVQTLMLCSWLQQGQEPGPLDTYRAAAKALLASID